MQLFAPFPLKLVISISLLANYFNEFDLTCCIVAEINAPVNYGNKKQPS